MIRRLLLILCVMQFFVCCCLAQTTVPQKKTRAEEAVKYETKYSAADAVKRGREAILEEKRQLEQKEKTEEEKAQRLEEEKEEARKEVYEQGIIEEAAMPRPMTALETQLQREKIRRRMMTAISREAEVPFKLKKRFNLRLSETYDDNIYLTKGNTKDDYITTLSPSVLLSIMSKYAIVDLNCVMDITRYRNSKSQSGTSYLLATYIRPGSLALPFFNRRRGKIGLEVQDDFQPLVTSIASSEQTSRTDRTYNRFSLAADYYMSTKRTLSLEYTNVYQDYHSSSSLDSYSYTENVISPVFYFHVRPKWSIFTGYDYDIMDYPTGTDSSISHRIRTGLTGVIFTKLLSRFEIGKEWRLYEESQNGRAQKIFFRTAFVDKFSPATTGFLRYDHRMEESTYTNNPYYITDDIRLNLEHKLTYKTAALLGLRYVHNTYDRQTTEGGATKKRRDYLWEPSVGLKYAIKRWLSADLTYTHRARDSNFKKFGYKDNRITGGVNFKF